MGARWSCTARTRPARSTPIRRTESANAQGRLLRTVPNRVGAWGEDPTRVGLMPGRYRIEALANSYGLVSVPVVIVANEVTTVHLEGSPEWPASPAFNAINSVRLPDGVVVGWKAEAGAMGGP